MRFVRICTCAVVTAVLAGAGGEAHGFGHFVHWRHGCCGDGCCRPWFPHLRALVGHIFHHHPGCGCAACGCGPVGCGTDCGLGGCGSGCSTCGGGWDGGTVIESAPTPAAPNAPPAPAAPSMPPPSEASALQRSAPLIRQASLRAVKNPSFGEGLHLFHGGSLAQAQQAFAASATDSEDPLKAYFLALTHYKLGDHAAAQAALAQALELERDHPVKGWGRRMERVQGHARVWLESARRQAGL